MSELQLSIRPNTRVQFSIVHEDEHFVIVSKPAGVVTQPGIKHQHDALLNGLFERYGARLQNMGKARDYGLIHRLDRPTSGLVVVGLSHLGYDAIRTQFAERTVAKTYLAVVHGVLRPSEGRESSPIKEVRAKGRKRAVVGSGRGAQKAVTDFETLVHARHHAMIACHPKTGRLHQIRVHMAHRGCPIVGDFDYGKRLPLDRKMGRDALALHAARLGFKHPISRAWVEFSQGIPEHFQDVLKQVGITCPRKWR